MSAALQPRGHWSDPVECGPAAGFGLYLHVPTVAEVSVLPEGFATGLVAELVSAAGGPPAAVVPGPAGGLPDRWPAVTAVYVGGAPTRLPAGALVDLVWRIGEAFALDPQARVTVECPAGASRQLLQRLAGTGVDRISAPGAAGALVERARAAGIAEIDLDLVHGLPDRELADWRTELARAVATGAEHLTVSAAGRSADLDRTCLEHAHQMLAAAGFEHYALCGFARHPGRRSPLTLLYDRHGDYLGLGPGARSHLRGRRWWSHESVGRYLPAVRARRAPVAGYELLSAEQQEMERLMLGLRLREGLHPGDLPSLGRAVLADTLTAGLVEETRAGRLRATDRGWFLLDEVVRRLTSAPRAGSPPQEGKVLQDAADTRQEAG